ncbi:MAG: DUF3365 domain-containing protein [Nitrospirota bacterium]
MRYKELGPKKRFTLLLILIYVISLPVISFITYYVLRKNAVNDAYNAGKLHLSTINSVKHYVEEDLRPIFYKEMPGRFIVEGMSRSFVATNIAERVSKELPAYMYKNASLNPRNPRNNADMFEAEIIRKFINERDIKEWKGFRERSGEEYYVIARPGEPFGPDCLRCHGDPFVSPKELLNRYGPEAGFHIKPGELNDAMFVYIPIGVPLAAAWRVIAVFIGIYILSGSIILSVIQTRFNRLYNQIDSDKQRIEDFNLELMKLNQDMESIITERTMNLIALSIADRVRNPATAISGTFNRILKKEEISGSLRERLTDLMIEAQKLDMIVKDYETILKNKELMFKFEDINEIIKNVMPLVEKEIKNKKIVLSLELSDTPHRCMANRQLLRVAILHVLKNAIEAVTEGGKIAVKTASEKDRITLSVTDTGKGIPKEDISKIFSLFYSTKKHRVGMGLPLVKQIIKEHKGEITVESEPGKGTVFYLNFPIRWSEQELSRPVSQ